MKFWRTLCNFDANHGVTHVEGRVNFELAETKEEAVSKTIKYLESWHYTNIQVVECHPETEAEKYSKQVEQTNYPYREKESVPDAPPDFGELF